LHATSAGRQAAALVETEIVIAAVAVGFARRDLVVEDAAAGLIVLTLERETAVAVAVLRVADDAEFRAAHPLLVATVSGADEVGEVAALLV
jgi:hypothetical protein